MWPLTGAGAIHFDQVVSKNWICFRSCTLQCPLQQTWLLSWPLALEPRPVSTPADVRRWLGRAR